MSKERARRRAEREAAAERERERRQSRESRHRRWAALVAPLAAPVRAIRSRPKVDSALTRARRRQDGAVLAVLLPLHVVLWLLTPSWWLRGSALVLSLLLWPLLVVLLFDRRST